MNTRKYLEKILRRTFSEEIIMENYWTSNKTINGLRHFVLVNETKEKGNISFLMVSVLDSEINLKTTYEDCLLYTSPSPRDRG